MLSVLVTAELVALVYYRALKNQTGSLVLRCICQTILTDERAHLEFESSMLRELSQRNRPVNARLFRMAHQVLLWGALRVVYYQHRQVIRSGGYTFTTFRHAIWHEFDVYFGKARMAPSSPLLSMRIVWDKLIHRRRIKQQ